VTLLEGYSCVYCIWLSPLYFILFRYIWGEKSAPVQLINYQLFTQILSFELKSNTVETNFILEILICAPGDFCISSSARFLDCQLPTLVVSMKISLLVYFPFGLKVCLCQVVATHCMLLYEYFVFPSPFTDQLNRHYFPLFAPHRVSDSKISGAIHSSLSLKVPWRDVYSVIYDGWLQIEGWQSFYLILKCAKNEETLVKSKNLEI